MHAAESSTSTLHPVVSVILEQSRASRQAIESHSQARGLPESADSISASSSAMASISSASLNSNCPLFCDDTSSPPVVSNASRAAFTAVSTSSFEAVSIYKSASAASSDPEVPARLVDVPSR